MRASARRISSLCESGLALASRADLRLTILLSLTTSPIRVRVLPTQLMTSRAAGAARSNLRQFVTNSISDQFSRAAKRELAHCGRAVRLHRLDAEIERPRDHLVAVALRDELHSLAFARGKSRRMSQRSRIELVQQG